MGHWYRRIQKMQRILMFEFHGIIKYSVEFMFHPDGCVSFVLARIVVESMSCTLVDQQMYSQLI